MPSKTLKKRLGAALPSIPKEIIDQFHLPMPVMASHLIHNLCGRNGT